MMKCLCHGQLINGSQILDQTGGNGSENSLLFRCCQNVVRGSSGVDCDEECKAPKPFGRKENLVPKVGIEPTRGVSPTGF